MAAIAGSYTGNLIASGVAELVGVDWKGGAWWDWILASLMISTVISLPVALLFLYTLVPFIHKLFGFNNTNNIQSYVITGIISGALPIIVGFSVNWIYSAFCCSIEGITGTFPVMLYLLSHAVCVGVASMLVLYYLSYNKSLNLTGANNAPPS